MKEKKTLLTLEGVSKDFFGNVVLKNINLEVKEGEIIGLVGENGAGKSTMMKIIFGMDVIRETGGYGGKVKIYGKEVNFKSPFDALDAGIGMVHQEFSLIPGFTATENIVFNRESLKKSYLVDIFGERIKQIDREKIIERAKKAIKELGVVLDPNMLVSEMPVGHKQFTEIAREIERSNTKLLVLDEPTAVLTESEAKVLLKTIKKLSKQGIAIIFITHRLAEILEVCDKVVVLRDGNLIQEVETSKTNAKEITEWMIGRKLEKAEERDENKKFNETILKVEKLWVDMPGETVRDVSFEVKKGEIFGIGGLAGQGKLGIANGIMGLHAAGGKVEFKEKEIELNNPKSALSMGINFVSEDRRGVGLLLDEPIDFNIAFTAIQVKNDFLTKVFGLRLRDDEAISKNAQKYIEKLEIRCVSEKQKAKELSGGNQQKVCLAKAFTTEPELLFVSEPTRGIDVGAKKIVLDTLKEYNEKYGTTIVISSSELEELRSVSDRIAIVSEGKIAGILPAKTDSVEFGKLMLGEKDLEKVEK
ncbi:sugar ABC transporter ATP-binding protein [Tepiditoga spiralis]|uniref:Sugar ABC transporter ATP-binding protein n=1 Tax=Tepiditoga spiralis TaxID=2108365 RepID=A0A7G1G364_9BACT|nr:sugar ABC transporter ATP-binding protein [Tepiditoga spiralis]BBE30848.1 sugar ABC transporter ATP-binding protein [Tepiditoga spiralis]